MSQRSHTNYEEVPESPKRGGSAKLPKGPLAPRRICRVVVLAATGDPRAALDR